MKKVILIFCLISVLLAYGCDNRKSSTITEFTSESTENEVSTQKQTDIVEKIYVYVCGKVKNPGVYVLTDGSRICDAIEMAGGAMSDAALDNLNLASLVNDGDKIYVCSEEEAVSFESFTESINDGKVNINTASKDVLMTLPGIGESKALAIIDYRENNGDFKAIEDIMNISGIKQSVFNKVKDMISI